MLGSGPDSIFELIFQLKPSDFDKDQTVALLFETATSPKETEYSTDTSLTVEDGDTVNIDYIGYIDDVAFDGGSTDGMGTSLTIGSGQYIFDVTINGIYEE